MQHKPTLVTMMVVCANSGVAFAHGGIGDEGDLPSDGTRLVVGFFGFTV